MVFTDATGYLLTVSAEETICTIKTALGKEISYTVPAHKTRIVSIEQLNMFFKDENYAPPDQTNFFVACAEGAGRVAEASEDYASGVVINGSFHMLDQQELIDTFEDFRDLAEASYKVMFQLLLNNTLRELFGGEANEH